MARVSHVLNKVPFPNLYRSPNIQADFAFNTIWSAFGTINQYNTAMRQAKEKRVLRNILVPEFAQFCDTKEQQSTLPWKTGIQSLQQSPFLSDPNLVI